MMFESDGTGLRLHTHHSLVSILTPLSFSHTHYGGRLHDEITHVISSPSGGYDDSKVVTFLGNSLFLLFLGAIQKLRDFCPTIKVPIDIE